METRIDVFIDLDDEKFKKKKLNPNDSLSSIRSQLKLEKNISFLSEEGYQIDIEDEDQTNLNDVMIKKEKHNTLKLKSNKSDYLIINIYLNNEMIHSGKYPISIKLKELSKNYSHLLPNDAVLLSEGYQADLEDFEEKSIIEILENNSIYYKSEEYKFKKKGTIKNQKEQKFEKPFEIEEDLSSKSIENISDKDKSEEFEEKIYIKIGKDIKLKKLRLSEKLNNLREEIKKELPFRFKFLDKGICLEENDEDRWTINDIISEEDKSKIINIQNCEEEKASKEDCKFIKFYNNDRFLFKKKLNINNSLEDIREDICELIPKKFIFLKKRREIGEDEEGDFTLKEIIKDDIVKLKVIDDSKINIEKKVSFIKFKLNGKELFANKINHNSTLFEVRRENTIIPDDSKFIKDGFTVLDERNTKIEDILIDNEFVHLKNDVAPPPAEVKKEMIKYKIYLNEKFLRFAKFKEETTLDDIRKILSTSISNNEHFISSEKEEISLENEDQWTLKDFCNKDYKICIETIKTPEPEKPELKLNSPIQGARLIGQENSNLKIYQYPNIPFNDSEKALCKTIMAVGETGSGKTTLLNSFLNFLMDIKYEDNFRYKIIVENTEHKSPGGSVTDNVNIYYIRTKLSDLQFLRIVDTPGFGDTRGLDYDKKIIDMIRETFTKNCDTINAICFVAKSNETRLNDFQKYIFAQVMALFGNDVGENFMAMLTFCDGQVPNIVKFLESKESIFSQIKEQIQDPWYLTFNNSAIFSGVQEKFTRSFWDLGMDSYNCFLTKLKMLPHKSLTLSKQVLELRKKLETTIIGLKPQIDRSLTIMENIRKEISLIKANKDKIDQFKDFKYKYKEPKVTKKNLKQGQYTSNCLICNYTCHYPCYIPDNAKKMNCSAMRNQFCTICKNKCKWDQHKNLDFIFVYEEVEKVKTSEDLRKKYVESSSNLKQSEQILKGLEKKFCDILSECYKNAETINKCVEQLKRDSLCKNPNESFKDYINNCISNEQKEKNPGYEDRIKGYEMLKDTNDKIIQAFKGQSIFENLDKFKEYILEEKEKIFKMYEKEEKNGDSCIIC